MEGLAVGGGWDGRHRGQGCTKECVLCVLCVLWVLSGWESDCLSQKKLREKRDKRDKGLAEAEIDCQCAGKYCVICVVCVIRVLSGWSVRLKPPKRLNGYTDLVALAAKSFVS